MRWRRFLTLAIPVLPAAAILVGCASHGSVVDDSQGARILASLSQLEQRTLEDKVVSAGELDAAASAYRDCVTSHGFVMDPYVPGTPVRDTPVSIVLVDDEDGPIREAELEACRAQVDAIDSVWVLQQAPTAAQAKEAERAFVACVAGLGLVEDGATFEDAASAFSEAAQSEEPFDEAGNPTDLQQCAADLTERAGTTALPGLAEALAELDT